MADRLIPEHVQEIEDTIPEAHGLDLAGIDLKAAAARASSRKWTWRRCSWTT